MVADTSSDSETSNRRSRAPAALFAMAPGASIGAHRKCVVEVKAANSCLVAPLEPNTSLVEGAGSKLLAGFDHITVHRDLMVHVQGSAGSIPLVPASVVNGVLAQDGVHLITLGTSPSGLTAPYSLRAQRHFVGGIPILPFAQDGSYDPVRTRLIVDLWASQPWFEAPAFLPLVRPNVRYAASYSGAVALGPLPAAWAFREGTPPPCVFHFRFWYTEDDYGTSGPIVIGGGLCLRIERSATDV